MGGNRVTNVELNGNVICLNDYYRNNQSKVSYNIFRTRVVNHKDIISEQLLYDALNLSKEDWISFYGGVKNEGFTYTGNYFSEYKNQTFHTLSAFLKLVGRYEKRQTIKQRLYANWDIDEAILRENVDISIGRIYLIKTTKNPSKKYVGQTTKTIEERFEEHKIDYRRSRRKNYSRLLYNAFEEYGVDSFSIELLDDNIEYKKLAEMENYYIHKYDTMYPHGLNMIKGAGSSLGYGKKISYNRKDYSSIKKLVKEVQKERPDLPDYTIEKCIRNNKELPDTPREHSKHPDAGSDLWRRWLSLWRRKQLCPEWSIRENEMGYENFKNDMGYPPSENHKLYRSNKKLLHSKENSCWMTDTEIQEQENGISVVVFGKEYHSRSMLAKEYGLSLSTLCYRMDERKMSAEEAVTYSGKTTKAVPCVYDDIPFPSKREKYKYCAKKYGMTFGQVKDHFERGIPLEEKLSNGFALTIKDKLFESIKEALAYFKLSPKSFYRIRNKEKCSAEKAILDLLENK